MIEEQVKQAMNTAYRAEGFPEYLSGKGLIGRGNEAREAIRSLLALEETMYPDFVVQTRIEVAQALARLLDSHRYNSGKCQDVATHGEQSWAKI